ncbi:MAG: GSCFA domain-containing protein [Sphingomonas sp.]|nr:GSCFA domain-containing protein [Sphingomonas sp.]
MAARVQASPATDERQPQEPSPLAKLNYEEALRNNASPLSRWPRDQASQDARLHPFCLPALQPSFSIRPDDLIFTIGSCFARNVEQHLLVGGFNVAISRFEQICRDEGVTVRLNTLNKFVAQSIVNELRWALEPGAEFPIESIVEVKNDRYLDMQLAPGLLPTKFETALGVRRAVSSYMRMVKDAKVVIVTLGLAEAWYDTKLGLYTNTMPLPATAERFPARFEHHVLEYNQLLASLRDMFRLLEQYGHPDFRMLLTVSPVALSSTFTEHDAMVANCYSKSVQRAAGEAFCRENPRVDYLPTFESVTLSDHSLAWREDRAHVSTEVVRLNVLRMENAYAARVDGTEPRPSIDAARVEALKLAKQANELFSSGEFERADDLFEQAVQIDHSEVLPHVQWGDALYRRQRWQEAARELQAAMDLGGRQYNVAYTLAKSYAKLSMWMEAEPAARAAIEDLPDTPGPYKLMAKVLKHLGRGSEARAYSDRYHQLTAGVGEDVNLSPGSR